MFYFGAVDISIAIDCGCHGANAKCAVQSSFILQEESTKERKEKGVLVLIEKRVPWPLVAIARA